MRFPLSTLFLLLLLLGPGFAAQAQDLEVQPTPFTALIDFGMLQKPISKMLPPQSLPIWLEAVQIVPSEAGQLPQHTTFRLRLRPMPGLNDSLLLRIFFEDRADARPTVSAWSETGDCRVASQPLGAGLGLPASQSLVFSTRGINYVEIDVPGDGSTVHQALLSTLKKSDSLAAFDFAPPAALTDPFGAAAPATPEANDAFLFGRIRATLEPGVVKLGSADAAAGEEEASRTVQFTFNLEKEPLLAMVTFDILNVNPAAPPAAWANGEPDGSVALVLPDLADPGYAGIVRPLEKMSFHYAGWVKCQKIIPGAALHIGENTFTLQLPAGAGPVAIRAVELQLKNHWQKLDYTLSPL